MSIKPLIIGPAALVILGGSFFFFGASFFPTETEENSELTALNTFVDTERKVVASDEEERQKRNPSEKPLSESNAGGYFDPDNFPSREDWLDVAEFHQDNAMWGGRESSGYKYYPQEQLLEMAENGDVQAMRELAYRFGELAAMRSVADMGLSVEPETNEDGLIVITDELSAELQEYYEKEVYYTDKAVVYGDRQLLNRLESFGEARRQTTIGESSEKRYDAALEMLAYYEFFSMRGMDDMKYEGMSSFFHVYGDKGILPEQFTDRHVEEIRQRAQAIYDSYEQQRLELGLGPFDNSVPKGKAQEFAWLTPAMVKMIKEETGYEVFW